MNNRQLIINVRKISFGRDGFIHLTIQHPKAKNFPTLIFTPEDIKKSPELQELVFKNI